MTARRHTTWVGFEPAADALRAVAVCSGRVLAATEVPLTGEDPVHTAGSYQRMVESMQRQSVPKDARWVCTPPEATIAAAVLELPPRTSGAPLEALAAAELSRDRDRGAMEVGLWELGASAREANTAAEYLVVGGAREGILGVVDACARVGVTVEAVDTPATAIARVAGPGVRLLAELCRSTIRVHVCSGGDSLFCYVRRLGPNSRQGDALVDEIDRCAAYLLGRGAGIDIQGVVLCGPGARDGGVIDLVRREFDTTVAVWRGCGMAVDESVRSVVADPAFAQACGLATWNQSKDHARRRSA